MKVQSKNTMTDKRTNQNGTIITPEIAGREEEWQSVIEKSRKKRVELFRDYEGTHHGETHQGKNYSFNLYDRDLKHLIAGEKDIEPVRKVVRDFPEISVHKVDNLTQVDRSHYLFRTADKKDIVVALNIS